MKVKLFILALAIGFICGFICSEIGNADVVPVEVHVFTASAFTSSAPYVVQGDTQPVNN